MGPIVNGTGVNLRPTNIGNVRTIFLCRNEAKKTM